MFEAYQAWQAELERQPVEFLGRRFNQLMAEARAALGAYLGADPDDLVYIPNATTGVNLVARGIPLEPGDEVLSTDHEYGACDRAWRYVCNRRGARYIRQPVPLPVQSVEEVVEAIWAGVSPRTRVLYFSHITSPTALIFPADELVRRAREAGIITVVDGAHAPGQVDLNLAELDADFYTGNLHKWALAPKGSAFLHARRSLQPLVEPLIISWGWESDFPGPSRFTDWHEWQGTRDPSAYLAVPTALQFMAEHDWPAVRARCHALASATRDRIDPLTGLDPICPGAFFGQMFAARLPDVHLAALKARLYDEHRVEVPVHAWNGQPLIRVSIQGYNDEADADALLSGLQQFL